MNFNKFIKWLVLIVPALFFESCIKSDYEPFETPPDLANAEKTLVDTFSLNLETYIIDSLNSTSRNILFAGAYPSTLGNIETKSYFQYLPESYNVAYPESLEVDSTVMLFGTNAFYGQDDTASFRLRELSQNLDGDKSYYTTDTFPVSIDANRFYVFGDTNKIKDSYLVRIHKLGKRIMEDWKNKTSYKSAADFLSTFHGFELTSPNPKKVTRFDLNDVSGAKASGFYIYCHTKVDGVITPKNYYFKVISGTVQFYNIKTTRVGKWLNLKPNEGLPANNIGDEVAVQGGTALATKIKLPGLSAWAKSLPQKVKIFKAELYIKPNGGGSILPPEYLRISSQSGYYSQVNPSSTVYNDGNILSLLSLNAASSLTRAGAKQYASAQVFPYNTVTADYKCNITSYVQDVVDGLSTTNELNLYSLDMATSLNQLIITKTADQSNLKLKVFYYKN